MGSTNLSLMVHAVGLIGIYSMYGVLQEGECLHFGRVLGRPGQAGGC